MPRYDQHRSYSRRRDDNRPGGHRSPGYNRADVSRPSYGRQDGPAPREYPGRQQRPAPKRQKPKGPSTFTPRQPTSRNDWKRMVGGTTARLARALGVYGGKVERMGEAELLAAADRLPTFDNNRHGRACRLIAKLIRLREGKPTFTAA